VADQPADTRDTPGTRRIPHSRTAGDTGGETPGAEETRGVAGTWAIYWRLIGAQGRAQAGYRLSFVLDLLGNLLFLGADLLTLLVIFTRVPALAGFSVREGLVIFGLASAAFALADLVVGNIERVKRYVNTGLLDTVMIRPLGVLPQLLAMDVGLRRIGRFIYALAILGFAVHHAGVRWTPGRVALLVTAPVFGAIFFGAFFVATATVAFWWVESGELSAALTYGGRDFTSYPINVYEGWFQRVFAFGLGFGFVAYYPALGLLGKEDPLGGPAWLSWSSPVVGRAAAAVAALIWRIAVRHYRSTGS
jgi:ABC-2 type transport system permease protein